MMDQDDGLEELTGDLSGYMAFLEMIPTDIFMPDSKTLEQEEEDEMYSNLI